VTEPAPTSSDSAPAPPALGTILDAVRLRLSAPGHIRFSLPPELCTAQAASALEKGIIREDGVYRVKVFRTNQKLSVHFQSDTTSLEKIGARMHDTLRALPAEAFLIQETEPETGATAIRLPSFASLSRAQGTIANLRARKELLQGAAGLTIDKETEKQLTTALNEIVLFYLVKLHWDVITKRLVKQPFRNIGPWFTLTYLLFLYVRHRKAD